MLVLAGVAGIGIGMALVIAGMVMPPLFRPGTFIIGLGMLVSAAAGVLAVARPGPPATR
jgi:hypothetical protein